MPGYLQIQNGPGDPGPHGCGTSPLPMSQLPLTPAPTVPLFTAQFLSFTDSYSSVSPFVWAFLSFYRKFSFLLAYKHKAIKERVLLYLLRLLNDFSLPIEPSVCLSHVQGRNPVEFFCIHFQPLLKQLYLFKKGFLSFSDSESGTHLYIKNVYFTTQRRPQHSLPAGKDHNDNSEPKSAHSLSRSACLGNRMPIYGL